MKNQLARFTGFIAAILFLVNLQLCAQQHAPDMITPQPSAPQNPEPPKALHHRVEGALIMPLSSEITPRAVLNAMQRVADWQLAHPSTNPPTGWIQAVDDAGMMALAGISGDPQYRDAMLAMGQTNDWQLGSRFYDADFHCIGQTYAELYLLYRDNRMIGPLQERFDGILAKPTEVQSLEFTRPETRARENWSWCDSLFMGPPTWVRLYAATGDSRYLDFAVTNWWRTTDYLYDKDEHLYFRDSTFFKKHEANGQKVFWSRGNGWVMAGLVRVLQYLPMNHPDRPRFEQLFKDMAGKVLSCQQSDGFWRASLLDPESYPAKETSGTSLFTYALAWGINQGLLDQRRFKPAVEKSWATLIGCVDVNGKLTHVQPVGSTPKKFNDDSTAPFGGGAFLLAGSEVYRMAVLDEQYALPNKFILYDRAGPPPVWGVCVNVKNPSKFSRDCETVALDFGDVVAAAIRIKGDMTVHGKFVETEVGKKMIRDYSTNTFVVMDGVSSRILDSQIYSAETNSIPDKLLFQVDLAPGEKRTFYVLDALAVPAEPPPIVKTFARYVPERYDDFAWESDRIAHRAYGLALIPAEGTISSAPDVWIKTWRNLMINEMYASGHYHMDNGDEMDDYRVGHSRGCGGLGIWDGKKLYTSSNYRNWKLITTGPIRSEFELTYDAWDAGNGRKVSEVKRYSIDAGSWFTKAQSTFSSEDKSPLTIGVGLAERACPTNREEFIAHDQSEGWMSYWQPEDKPKGIIGVAMVLPKGSVEVFTNDAPDLPESKLHAAVPQPTHEGYPPIRDMLAIAQAEVGKPFEYYFGACWDRSGDFTNHVQWENYVRRFAERRDQPLQVTVGN